MYLPGGPLGPICPGGPGGPGNPELPFSPLKKKGKGNVIPHTAMGLLALQIDYCL